VKENAGTLLGACKDVGLEIRAEKAERMSLSRHQIGGLYRQLTGPLQMGAFQVFRNGFDKLAFGSGGGTNLFSAVYKLKYSRL
jgi:hypothetical protein